MRILIKTPKFIGDTIMMLPALTMLQKSYPDAEISIVCNPHFEALFRGMDIKDIYIDNTRGKGRLKKTKSLLKELKKTHYDRGYLFHNSLASALLFKLSKINTTIGYNTDSRGFLLDKSFKLDRVLHYQNRYALLVNHTLKTPFSHLPTPKLHTTQQQIFTKNDQPTIGLVLGTDKGDRGYPKEQALTLSTLLAQAPYQILLLGDKHDAPSNAQYAKIMPNAKDLSNKTDLAGFIDTIADLDLLVTIDTSAVHIASATNTPFIALIGHGTSPFCCVKPKTPLGSYLYHDSQIIDTKEMIASISPTMILEEIQKRLS